MYDSGPALPARRLCLLASDVMMTQLTKLIQFRVTEQEFAHAKSQAAEGGQTVSELARSRYFRGARPTSFPITHVSGQIIQTLHRLESSGDPAMIAELKELVLSLSEMVLAEIE